MVYSHAILAVGFMLSTYASAGVVQPPAVRRVEPLIGDLTSARDIEHIDADTLVIAAPSEPIVLAPLRDVRRLNTKRDRRAALGLKEQETLYWKGQDGTVAALKIEMPGESENIVNLELIDDMVQAVHCPRNATGQFKLSFAQEADFDDAEDIWQWVNQEVNNHFTLVVGAGACGWNEERIVYTVTGLVYNDERETAILDVQRTTWKEAAHTFDLTVGKPAAAVGGASAQRRLARDGARRGIFGKIGNAVQDAASGVVDAVGDAAGAAIDTVTDVTDTAIDAVAGAADTVVDAVDSAVNPDVRPDFTIPFSSDFSNKSLSFAKNGVEISGSCQECFTTGAFDIEGRFRVEQFQMKEAWIEVSTRGIQATAVIGITLKGDLTGKLAEKSVPIFKVSPAGVAIPGVLTIGPTVSVSLGAEISEIKGGVSVSLGGTTTIPPSTARLDFLSQSRTTSTGWRPSFEVAPMKADAFVEAKATAFLKAAIGLEISAVGM